MRKPTPIAVLASLLALALVAAAASTPAAEGAHSKGARLQAFGSCGELLGYLKRQAAPLVGPWGLGGSVVGIGRGAVAAPVASESGKATGGGTAGVDYSTTNVQEEGIDEPDIVKTDGTRIFAVNGSMLRAVDVRSGRPRLAGSLRLPTGWDHELLLRGDRLLVLSRGGGWIEPLPGMARASLIAPGSMNSTLTEIDVSDTSSMRVVRTIELDGGYVSARLTEGTARVVVSSALPQTMPFPAVQDPGGATTSAQATAHNRAVVARSGLKAWLPRYVLTDRRQQTKESRALVQCRNVRRPASFSGLGLLTVLTIDLDKGLEPVDSDAIVADGRIVYASAKSLYVATERWADRPATQSAGEVADGVTTAIHKFDIGDPGHTQYRASGQVSGILLNQWSLSEHAGDLRVASTDTPTWWNPGSRRESESFVTVLREQAGKLTPVGRVGELGKGERIYAVRFMGDTGYVVTFRQVDPLYTLDLSDPTRPAVLGELEIPGFSSYLHPIGDDVILGVGQDATDEGRVVGTQLSLFDVSNLRQPTRLHHLTIGRGYSEAEYDHHAFLYWPKTKLAVIPVQTFPDENGAGETFSGALGFSAGRVQGIARVGKVAHPSSGAPGATPGADGVPIRRSLVIHGVLYTVSEAGVQASSLAKLDELGWAAFPQPSATP